MKDWPLPGPDDLILDLDDAAKFVGMSKNTIRALVKAGTFPRPRKFGASWRWTGADLAAWIQLAGRLGPDAEAEDES